MTAIYIICAVSMASALVTAIAYTNKRLFIASSAKLLASMSFVSVGMLALLKSGVDSRYGIFILAGLVMGLIGDIMLLVKEFFTDRQSIYFLVTGVTFFIFGHVFFIFKFIEQAAEFRFYLLPLLILLPVGILLTSRLKFVNMGKLIPFMIFYGLVLNLTAVGALNLLIDRGGDAFSLTLFIGSLLFILSDTALCFDYFGAEKLRKVTNYFVMLNYFAAQLCFAVSIALF